MPLKQLLDISTGKRIDLDQAPEYFHEKGLMPGPVLHSLIDNVIKEERKRRGSKVSPSMADPGATCRREEAIKRNLEYALDPLVIWEAFEGTIWHEALLKSGGFGGGGWEYEVELGPVELFDGVIMTGTADAIHRDNNLLVDLKTQRFSKRDYGSKPSWSVQSSMYAHMLGEELPKVEVWRIYRGSYERERTFKKFPVSVIPLKELDRLFADFLRETQEILRRAELEGEEYIKTLPMEGKTMFNGKKCHMYCSVKDICFAMAGESTF